MDAIPITKKLIAFGSKKIHLYATPNAPLMIERLRFYRPKFTVALVRTPTLPPYHARFLVPLDFSKYDLRDYLYHAYNVKCFNVRSYVKQMPVRDTREQPRHWFRPESKKYMTVEMEQPFVWPEMPESLEPWGQKERQKEVDDATKVNGASDKNEARAAARELRDQVKKLLHKDVARPDHAIERKKAQLKELTPEELEAEELREKEEAKLKQMSRIKLWERERTAKIVESDKRGRYAIKV
jgi:large subunit ribosomal protein L23